MSDLPQGRIVAAIARHELRITLRNRWLMIYSAIFAVLTLAVSYFGLTVIEFTGFQEFDRTAVSLLNLVLYIVPLATMLSIFRKEMFGPAGAQLVRALGGIPQAVALLVAALVAWIALPTAVATVSLSRQDL